VGYIPVPIMVTYIFRSAERDALSGEQLELCVRGALSEIPAKAELRYDASHATITSDAHGYYVLLPIDGTTGWHYHQAWVFDRHGITCAYYPSARPGGRS
jgi:hypothetical protein